MKSPQPYYELREDAAVIKFLPMNERQRAHIDYFLERVEYWRGLKRDASLARMLAARDATTRTHCGARKGLRFSSTCGA